MMGKRGRGVEKHPRKVVGDRDGGRMEHGRGRMEDSRTEMWKTDERIEMSGFRKPSVVANRNSYGFLSLWFFYNDNVSTGICHRGAWR